MFERRKTIGKFKFSVTTTLHDPLHHRRGRDRAPDFHNELTAAQRRAIVCHQLLDNRSVREVYRQAISRCPSISMDIRREQGRPCIAGTRIPVHLVLWAVEHSGSIKGALKSYPDLTAQQVKDALYFAETILGSPSVITEAALTA
jgi:uncharacterized protein (DUF433 family)